MIFYLSIAPLFNKYFNYKKQYKIHRMQSKSQKSSSAYTHKSRYPTTTKNPSNEFLVQFLVKLRQKQCNLKLAKGKPRQDHQFHVYTRAIDSIKKYPLPIICEEQLGLLAGVGDSLSGKLAEAIKQYYKRYLKICNGQIKQKSGQELKIMRKSSQNERQKNKGKQHVKILNWTSSPSESSVKSNRLQSEHSQIQEQQSENGSQNRDKIHPLSMKSLSDYDKKSSKSDDVSQKKSLNQKYKPRNGSQASNILKVFNLLDATDSSVTKRDIDKALLQNNYQKIKQWKNCRQMLIKNEYIETDPSVQYQSFFLTKKGKQYVSQYQFCETSNNTKKKLQQKIIQFKERYAQKQKQKQQASQSISFVTSQQNSQTNSRTYLNLNDGFVCRKTLQKKQNQKLILVIDTRQMKDQSQKSYFQETLIQKYKIDVITHVLSIGDFAFSYNGQVLDYIIERKKADDLAASIFDGRYKQQKFRLKNCGASNIIYLYQGHPSQNSALKQKQLMNALVKTQVVDKFKICKTSKISETAKYLYHLYSELQSKIEDSSQNQLMTIGSLQQFNRRNTKNRYLTVENVFGFGLKTFPNVGKQTVTNILRYFKSYYLLYKQLQNLSNKQERIQFLNGLLKGGRTQSGVAALIVQFLFHDDKN